MTKFKAALEKVLRWIIKYDHGGIFHEDRKLDRMFAGQYPTGYYIGYDDKTKDYPRITAHTPHKNLIKRIFKKLYLKIFHLDLHNAGMEREFRRWQYLVNYKRNPNLLDYTGPISDFMGNFPPAAEIPIDKFISNYGLCDGGNGPGSEFTSNISRRGNVEFLQRITEGSELIVDRSYTQEEWQQFLKDNKIEWTT